MQADTYIIPVLALAEEERIVQILDVEDNTGFVAFVGTLDSGFVPGDGFDGTA